MQIFYGLLGMAASFLLLKYRQQVGDTIGEAEWMKKVGGVYMVIIIFAILLFFWCIAELTGTTNILFSSFRYLIPGGMQEPAPTF